MCQELGEKKKKIPLFSAILLMYALNSVFRYLLMFIILNINSFSYWFNVIVVQLLREITHENVVTLVNVHINHADMSLYLAFDFAEHDLYVSFPALLLLLLWSYILSHFYYLE